VSAYSKEYTDSSVQKIRREFEGDIEELTGVIVQPDGRSRAGSRGSAVVSGLGDPTSVTEFGGEDGTPVAEGAERRTMLSIGSFLLTAAIL
jgi:hypothetical protein